MVLLAAPNNIGSFAELMTKFMSHFSHNKKLKDEEEDLYELYKEAGTLRKYLKMFNDTKASLRDCRENIVISVFIKGMIKDTRVHIKLTNRKPITFFDLSNEVEGWITYKDDLEKKKKKIRDPKREKDRTQAKENLIPGINPSPSAEGKVTYILPEISIVLPISWNAPKGIHTLHTEPSCQISVNYDEMNVGQRLMVRAVKI